MLGDRARTALTGTRFADVRWVDETGSTNADLLALAADELAGETADHGATDRRGVRRSSVDGAVLVADHQTAGRGRLGRTWEAPAGTSLLCSTLIRPDLPLGQVQLVTMAVGIAASDACDAVAGVRPGLKWPNDLVIAGPDGGDHKMAGVLAESIVREGSVAALVIGMGLNVNWPADLPDDLAAIATSLNHHAGRSVDREDLLAAHLLGLETMLAQLGGQGGRDELLLRYRQLSATLGRQVRVEMASSATVGTAVDVTDEGHLLVDVGGEIVPIAAGDVIHLRPAD
jgi:BirA family biotin operon repressor/biotin-[acetyl-CoA-carboxylase] ligase